eukprot:739027_1
MSAFSSLALAICTITAIIVAVDLPISCTRTAGAASSGNPGESTVTCALASETMVSCGVSGNDRQGGTYIDPTTNQCTAFDLSPSGSATAQAHCCAFPPEANITTTTVSSYPAAGTSVLVQCPTGSELTGCSALHSTGTNANLIQGTFAGLTTTPPQTAAWIDTDNTCIAVASAGATVEAVARCVTINDPSYALECQTKAAVAHHANFGSCDSGYDMMSCHAFSTGGSLDSWYVTDSDTCYVQRDSHTSQYANAICCKLTLTTSSPTTVPTQTPTQHPTDVPTQSPTRHPTDVPTQTPSQSPTRHPTLPTDVPTQSPTRHPTDVPTQTPSQSPTRHPTDVQTQTTFAPTFHPTESSDSLDSDDSWDDSSGSMDTITTMTEMTGLDDDSDDDVSFDAAMAREEVMDVVADNDVVSDKNYNLRISLSKATMQHLFGMIAVGLLVNMITCFCVCKK